MGQTRVSIDGDDFVIDGQRTYAGCTWHAMRIEGLLFNTRMVQAIFDDLNRTTRERWAYPDTGTWDANRNVDELVGMLSSYRRYGLLAVTLNLQGGCPEGYCAEQPWDVGAFEPDGSLRPAFMARLDRVLRRMDDLGMVAVLGLFYFGQDERLRDEQAILQAVDDVVGWLFDHQYQHVIVEIANECDVPRYEHSLLQPERIHELIARVRAQTSRGERLLVGTSYRGGSIPGDQVLAVSDIALLHGNGVREPARIARMVADCRARAGRRQIPVLFNEDDHFDFARSENNMLAATRGHASWGYFDPGAGAGGSSARSNYVAGFQNVPVNWRITTERKRAFFSMVAEITGADGRP